MQERVGGVPYARNARKHPPAQIATLAGMIRQFGFRSPVLVDGARSIIASTPVPAFGPRMVCTGCGIVGADARPNWQERSREGTAGAP
jgi:hypothetical protein